MNKMSSLLHYHTMQPDNLVKAISEIVNENFDKLTNETLLFEILSGDIWYIEFGTLKVL